jgi:hypothetical protein
VSVAAAESLFRSTTRHQRQLFEETFKSLDLLALESPQMLLASLKLDFAVAHLQLEKKLSFCAQGLGILRNAPTKKDLSSVFAQSTS